MKLEYLSIYKSIGEGYAGTAKFSGSVGTTELKLTPAISQALLAIVAKNLIEASREVARELTAECIESTPTQLFVQVPDGALERKGESE